MGGSYIRLKAEVDMDGKEITRAYLQKLNPYEVLQVKINLGLGNLWILLFMVLLGELQC